MLRLSAICLLALSVSACDFGADDGPIIVEATRVPAVAKPAAENRGAPAQDAQSLSSEDVKSLCDRSVRWMRAQQDADGGYGDVRTTALVLEAFALSPRRYTADEGPFVARAIERLIAQQRESGAICAPDATPLEALEETLAAARALALYGGGAAGQALLSAENFLRVPAVEPRTLGTVDTARGEAFARRAMAEIAEDGSYDGPDGALVATAERVLELASAYAAIRTGEKSSAGGTAATTALPAFTAGDRARVEEALVRGANFLVESAGGEGDLWGAGGQIDPGISALVVSALQSVPVEKRTAEQNAAITRGLAYLRELQKDDGSVHVGGQLVNYVTSASILALAESGEAGDIARIANAVSFLKELQADEAEGYGPSHKYYGGIGYGGDERPDLSNVWLAANALEAAGVSDDDEALAKMVAFLQRTQNRSESNDLVLEEDGKTIRPGNDGGAGYAPGQSKAGMVTLPDGSVSPRSYGSMTYALLGCYLFAGLEKTDPRVQAAWKWIGANYTLDLNPGFEASADPSAPYQGLFYYFNAMAKALDAYGEDVITDADGTEHRWRTELAGRLTSLQRPDGSWINENSPRWWEGNPVLATAYALVTLDVALPEAPKAD
ncbi:hypothetical protein Pla163_18010 [Planctomycetes bacterium Pla163]|uniref:Squalene cyclase C-terminal domain-containing protein n=1 Tax=Rohdeia mirabilis TaxID=2528008 RepID=A0A518CZN4_9BACT|nr:hypothetical protein Pla163_18010 [Planctomycetes bacterium Pla163]